MDGSHISLNVQAVMIDKTTANNIIAKGGVSHFVDSFMITASAVLRMNVFARSPPFANR